MALCSPHHACACSLVFNTRPLAAASARIGDGLSTYRDGVLSRVNATAAAFGARAGMTAIEFVEAVLACHKGRNE